MGFVKLFLIGIGLAMDAFAVSVSSGITIHNMRLHHALRIGLFFGAFQAIMPFLGWSLGGFAASYIKSVDHWVAFGLLGFVGGKMVWESFQTDENEENPKDPLDIYVLFTLAVATSIDALAVGVTFSCLGLAIVMPVFVIGVVTFFMSVGGVYIGDHFGHKFNEKRLETVGGLLLIGIGLKILIEHLFFS